jgi:hypothetical protein
MLRRAGELAGGGAWFRARMVLGSARSDRGRAGRPSHAADGAAVLYGRCDEELVPYQPFVDASWQSTSAVP